MKIFLSQFSNLSKNIIQNFFRCHISMLRKNWQIIFWGIKQCVFLAFPPIYKLCVRCFTSSTKNLAGQTLMLFPKNDTISLYSGNLLRKFFCASSPVGAVVLNSCKSKEIYYLGHSENIFFQNFLQRNCIFSQSFF